jgi:hypothetical protein
METSFGTGHSAKVTASSQLLSIAPCSKQHVLSASLDKDHWLKRQLSLVYRPTSPQGFLM